MLSACGYPLSRRADWRMPPLAELPRPRLTMATRAWMGVLRGYLVIAVLLVAWKIVQAMLVG